MFWINLSLSQVYCVYGSHGCGLLRAPAPSAAVVLGSSVFLPLPRCREMFSVPFPQFHWCFTWVLRGQHCLSPPSQFCRGERKKDLGRLCALQLWLLFPILTSVPGWAPSQDSHESFLHVPSEVCGEETTTRSYKLFLYLQLQGLYIFLPALRLTNAWTVPAEFLLPVSGFVSSR